MMPGTVATDVTQPSVLQIILLGIGAVSGVVATAKALFSLIDDDETRNPARLEGSPGSASSVNGGWRRRPEDSRTPVRRVSR